MWLAINRLGSHFDSCRKAKDTVTRNWQRLNVDHKSFKRLVNGM